VVAPGFLALATAVGVAGIHAAVIADVRQVAPVRPVWTSLSAAIAIGRGG
jgi:hypothetical protein